MAAKEKKPEKDKKKDSPKKGPVTCERTYVSDRYIRNQQESRRSPTISPEPIRVPDVPCRHQRRGAVRDTKRNVSLNKPRPAQQRADNAYVETTFGADADATRAAATRAATTSTTTSAASTSTTTSVASTSTTTSAASTCTTTLAASTSTSTSAASTSTTTSAASTSTDSNGHSMLLSDEAPPRFGEGIIDEYAAYVPWKATEARKEVSCDICKKCRCKMCQHMCKYPGIRVCGVLDVNPLYHQDTVRILSVCCPCVRNTAMCRTSEAARARSAAAEAEARAAGPAATRTASSNKCRLRWLLCCLCIPCPCCTVDSDVNCADGCRGNRIVRGCQCVDRPALKVKKRRVRIRSAATSLVTYRVRRRCRDDHYYRQYTESRQRFPDNEPDSSGFGENAETVNVEKKSKLRTFLRL